MESTFWRVWKGIFIPFHSEMSIMLKTLFLWGTSVFNASLLNLKNTACVSQSLYLAKKKKKKQKKNKQKQKKNKNKTKEKTPLKNALESWGTWTDTMSCFNKPSSGSSDANKMSWFIKTSCLVLELNRKLSNQVWM